MDNDKSRFAKFFQMVVNEGGDWLKALVEDRLKSKYPGMTLKEFVKAYHEYLLKDPILQKWYHSKTDETPDLSGFNKILQLRKIPKTSEKTLLSPNEYPSKKMGPYLNTVGDLSVSLFTMRNEIVHTTTATLSEKEYERQLDDIKYIAKQFEINNAKQSGFYVNKLVTIDNEPMDKDTIERALGLFHKYVENVVKLELPERPIIVETVRNGKKETSFTMMMANGLADEFENPVMRAAGGVAGGAVGLATDLVTAPARFLHHMFN